jgi:hypothetical protein
MPYVGRDGTIGGPKSISRTISDFFAAIINFVALIFSSITNPPQRLESRATYAQRNNGRAYRGGSTNGGNTLGGGRGSNIRGVKNLCGGADAKMGGG